MNLHSLLFGLLILSFTSCSDSISEGDNPSPNPNLYDSTPLDRWGEMEVSASPENHSGQLLGRGLDITGAFLHNSSLREAVLDKDKIPQDRITNFQAPASGSLDFAGCNALDLLEGLTATTGFDFGKDVAFTGTLSLDPLFHTPYEYSSQYSFALIVNYYRKNIIKLLTLNMDWDKALSDEFRTALATLSAEEIVARFGTHLLIQPQEGSLHYGLVRSLVTAPEDKKRQITQLGASKIIRHLITRDNFNPLSLHWGVTLSHHFQGGDLQKVPASPSILPSTAILTIQIGEWLDSINASENCGLVQLDAEDVLPIWEVVSDPELRQELQRAVGRHIHHQQIALLPTRPLIEANTQGGHRYYTSIEEIDHATASAYRPIGSVFATQVEGTQPLYTTGKRLSMSEQGRFLGYIYTPSEHPQSCATLYEQTNGYAYCYTTTPKEESAWRPTGTKFYLPRTHSGSVADEK